ncbi:MAG: hypothetical protein ACJ77N_07910 [Chloroflexota bacterium]|jgi:hypothetical protein
MRFPIERRDPHWDTDGVAARRSRLQQRVVGSAAFAVAWLAVAASALGWLKVLTAASLPAGLDAIGRAATSPNRPGAVFAPTAILPTVTLVVLVPAGLLVATRLVRMQQRIHHLAV